MKYFLCQIIYVLLLSIPFSGLLAYQTKFLSFYSMLKWGIKPVEAYQLVVSKDICLASKRVKAILKKKKWYCWKEWDKREDKD